MKDERYVEVLAGVEKIRDEKPYKDRAAAVAALDWLSAATTDLQKAVKQATEDPTELARMQELLQISEDTATSIEARLKRDGESVPARHQDQSGPVQGG